MAAHKALRSRSCPGSIKNLDTYAVEGIKVTHVNQLSNAADRAPVDINLALTSVTSATITIALQLQPLLDIVISEEVHHLDSLT